MLQAVMASLHIGQICSDHLMIRTSLGLVFGLLCPLFKYGIGVLIRWVYKSAIRSLATFCHEFAMAHPISEPCADESQ